MYSLEWAEVATVRTEKRVFTLASVGITGYHVIRNVSCQDKAFRYLYQVYSS